jgi:hypothetical protein
MADDTVPAPERAPLPEGWMVEDDESEGGEVYVELRYHGATLSAPGLTTWFAPAEARALAAALVRAAEAAEAMAEVDRG